jgi:hypothetical protein
MNAPAGTAVIAPEVGANTQPLVTDDKGLLTRAAGRCPMEHTWV